MDRRTFLTALSGAAAATVIGRRLAWAEEPHRIKTIGIELYTVRDALKLDYDGTLAQLAELGYREVESGGGHDKPPKEMHETLKRYGLTSPSYHVDWKSLGDDWPKVIEDNKIVGGTYRVNPWIDETVRDQPDGWKARRTRSTRPAKQPRKPVSSSLITSLDRIHSPSRWKTSIRRSAGKLRSELRKDGNGFGLDHGGR